MGLVSELRRRNVIRVAIAYAVAAWLLIEVSATTFPMLRLPEWTATFVAVLLMIGFPVALIFAWAFELTPEGIKLEKHIVRDESITHFTGRKLDFVIIGLLVAALGYFSYDKFVLDPSRKAELVRTATEAVTEQAAVSGNAETVNQSIAVLAFTDLSPEGDQEYFSDGISEELLNVLAKTPGLRVAARTSSFRFKGENRDVIDIGEQLNTAFVLEGSVRKAGPQVRITAQLVDARNGFHLWSETYDRKLENIFAVQDEVSEAIVLALREHLGFQLAVPPPMVAAANAEAHEAYLKGRHLVVQRTPATIEGAVREFEKAILLDPDYALAHAELALATLLLPTYSDVAISGLIENAAAHAGRAIALDPALAEAHAATGYVLWYQQDLEEALTHFERAIQVNPNYAIVYVWAGNLLNLSLGRYEEAFVMQEKGAQLDPLSIPTVQTYAWALILRNRLAEANRVLENLALIAPAKYAESRGQLTSVGGKWANLLLAHLDAWRLDPENEDYNRGWLGYLMVVIGLENEALANLKHPWPSLLRALGKPGDAITTAEERVAEDPIPAWDRELGLALAAAGDYSRARPILEEIWQRSGARMAMLGLFNIEAAAALIAIRRDTGEEAEIGELLAAIRDDVRRSREAGITRADVDYSADYEEGLAAYLSGEPETGLALIAKGAEDGYFILQREAYLQALYDDPGFAAIRENQEARQTREREKLLSVVCGDNPYSAVWQPAEGTCERFAAAAGN